jgi:hypothetical protein
MNVARKAKEILAKYENEVLMYRHEKGYRMVKDLLEALSGQGTPDTEQVSEQTAMAMLDSYGVFSDGLKPHVINKWKQSGFIKQTPDTTSEDNALDKARGLHGEVILDSSTDGMLAMEMAVHYETALQQERERAERYREKVVDADVQGMQYKAVLQEYENSLTGVMSLLKNAQERAESYKAVLQELEKYFQIMGGEEIPAEHCIKQLQDLKKKHGVDK